MWVTSPEFEATNQNYVDLEYFELYDQDFDASELDKQLYFYNFLSMVNNGGYVNPQNDAELLSRLPCVESYYGKDFGLERMRLLSVLIMEYAFL